MMTADDVNKIPAEYIHCRAYGHHWNAHEAGKKGRGFWEVQVCAKCPASRRREYNRYGEIEHTAMHYPKDYIVKGSGGFDKRQRGSIRRKALGL